VSRVGELGIGHQLSSVRLDAGFDQVAS
jgi:hypothetical protein